MELNNLQSEFIRLAREIQAPTKLIVFRTKPEEKGGSHVEIEGGKFYYVTVVPEMRQVERRQASSFDEILYWLINDLTLAMAAEELNNRIDDHDCAAAILSYHVELISRLMPEWGEITKKEYEMILPRLRPHLPPAPPVSNPTSPEMGHLNLNPFLPNQRGGVGSSKKNSSTDPISPETIQDEPSQEIQIFAENLDLLELEFKALQHELADLKSLKVEIEKELKDFASRYDLELGEIILKLLDLRAQFSESKNDNPDTEKEARRAKNDYEEYKSKLESAEVSAKLDLSTAEQAELKKAFRMASKLCHPDIVAHDEKERANQIFINLKIAYEKNNLLKVNEILRNLQINGLDMNFERGASGRAALEQQLHDLKNEISKIRDEINKIRKTESYRILYSTKDINAYFKVKRVEIEKEISILRSHNGTSG
jgi:hypothetical protein